MILARFFVGILLAILAWNSISQSKKSSDFQDYYQAAIQFLLLEDIYAIEGVQEAQGKITSINDIFLPENAALLDKLINHTGSYIYPPTFAFLLIPISSMQYELAALLFTIFNYSALLLSLFLIYRWVGRKWEPSVWWWSLGLALLLSFRFLENHSNNNQVAFLLFLLIIASITIKQNWISGLLLSLAIAIKLTPAVFLVYFFWKKRYSALGWTMIFLTGWILLPGIYSWDDNIRYLLSWNDLVLQSAMKTPLFRAWKNNQSIIATLAKYFLPFADPTNQATYRMPWIQLGTKTVYSIFYTIFVLFGLALLRSLFFTNQKPSKEKVLSLLFILSVLFSGIAWLHSFSFLLFPFLILFKEYLEGGFSPNEKKGLLLIVILFLLPNHNFIGGSAESFLFMISIFAYSGGFLFFFMSRYQEEIQLDSNLMSSPIKSVLKIAVDARPFAYGVTGNSRYLAEVLSVLGKKPDLYKFYLFSHKGIHPVFKEILSLPAVELVQPKSMIPGPIWLHTVFPWSAKRCKADIIWGTLQLLPFGRKLTRTIVNYHDLNVYSAPQTMARWNYFQHRLFSKRSLQVADTVICLSKNTINDIATNFPEFKEKCKLVYPGVSPIAEPIPPSQERSFGKFLFTLGTLEPRKNLKTLIQAFLNVKTQDPAYPYSLVIAGRAGWGKEESLLMEKLKNGEFTKHSIFFQENPGEAELAWYYKNCQAFLFPSLHEGFGLPLLEAMREGKNCIASNIPVFTEILDPNLDILLPALDIDSWSKAIVNFAKNPPRKRIWNPKDWTWESTAKNIAEELVN
jgi:glycosyltransferase involved in cell wall biosynthesis